MNVRKALVDSLVCDLEMRMKKAQWELYANKTAIKKLAEEQKRLKKTCGEIGNLIYELRPPKPKETK